MNRFLQGVMIVMLCISCSESERKNESVRGWSILTENPEEIRKVINKVQEYDINHLQLSHNIIMDLNEVKDPEKRNLVNSLIDEAHKGGVKEVTVWDHALYHLDYYPETFKTGPKGTINLDNPGFWTWLRQDYRDMIHLIPRIDGLILTFIETGARAELQYSQTLKSAAEKLAVVINNIADVVIGEMNKKLYIRTFAYDSKEYEVIINCVEYLKYDEIILMMKETPHDFFLTHPDNMFAGTIDRPTIIEFDVGNEFNGQGVIANTWPEHVLKRWESLKGRKNIIGYVARTDRFGNTSVMGNPSEILLYALKRYTEDTTVNEETIYDEFISSEYGQEALPWLKEAFKGSYDIITSSLYTLGTNTANHSGLNFDTYPSSYARHVSGKWRDPPVVYVKHGVNKSFHYWKDIVEHMAPKKFKKPKGQLEAEVSYVLENNWVTTEEQMDEEFLNYMLKEKKFGVEKASEALSNIKKAEPHLSTDKYEIIYHTFYRTLLTARLYEAVTKAYFGYRIYARGEAYRTETLKKIIKEGLAGMKRVVKEMDGYKASYPLGQWDWKKDAETAKQYYRRITVNGWTDYDGVVFTDNE